MSAPIQDLIHWGRSRRGTSSLKGPHHNDLPRHEKASNGDTKVADLMKNKLPVALTTSGKLIRFSRFWDVKMPPVKKHMVGSHLVPTVKTAVRIFVQRKSRLTLEVHGSAAGRGGDRHRPNSQASTATSALQSHVMEQLLQGHAPSEGFLESGELRDGDVVYFRIMRQSKDSSDRAVTDEHDEARSVPTLGSLLENEKDNALALWTEHSRYRLDDVKILKCTGRAFELKLGSGGKTVIRDIKFDGEGDATTFQETLEKLRGLERARAHRQVQTYRESKQAVKSPQLESRKNAPSVETAKKDLECQTECSECINLLVEVVSATDLPPADIYSSDPYVIVRMGGKKVHKTGVLPKNLDPVWTISTGSLFLLQMAPEDFFGCTSGMTFILKDFDAVGSNETLGQVVVPLETLLEGKGERIGFELHRENTPKKRRSVKPAYLYLRFKQASNDEIEFMKVFQAHAKRKGLYLNETFLPIRAPESKLLQRHEKKDGSEKLFRVKPFPDPLRQEETKWMTERQIEDEAQMTSRHWVEAGSGDLGKLYFELIGCNQLPNMDRSTLKIADKTDAFASIVFEDSVVNSDVISDSLSPRWMPWCRRAFAFNIAHPSSLLLLGIFDFDAEASLVHLTSKVVGTQHDKIGRVTVHIPSLLPNTTYDLTYPLYYGDSLDQRLKERGTVSIRLRVEWKSTRVSIYKGLMPPSHSYVSVARKADFHVAKYTVEGIKNDKDFSLRTLTEHIKELQSYEPVLDHIRAAALSDSSFTIQHGLTITFNYSIYLGHTGWGLLLCNEAVRKHPSHWQHCPRYWVLFYMLMFDVPIAETVASNENLYDIVEYNKAAEALVARHQQEKEEEAKNEQELRKELGEEIEEATAEDVDIATIQKNLVGNVIVNPLKPILYPIQQQLRKTVISLRIARSVLLWREPLYAFWIVTLSCMASFLVMWVPWAFLIRWLLRILAWLVLGPWMGFVGRRLIQDDAKMTDQERVAAAKSRLRARYDQVIKAATAYQIRKERMLKLKDMKRYMFGQYLIGIPRISENCFEDHPLPVSRAEPFHPEKQPPIVIAERKYGQRLSCDMIPKREIQAAESEIARRRPAAGGRAKWLTWRRAGERANERAWLFPKKGTQYQAVSTWPPAEL